MCILFAAYQTHPDYPLIIAANRDEMYTRPTKEAHFWDNGRSILAGKDLQQHGTWLGITKTGRFAALTNFRNPKENRTHKRSRGHIVKNFLTSDVSPYDFLIKLQQERNSYPGFNVIVSDLKTMYYYSNIENKIKQMQAGIHGLSNRLLNTPWPKVEIGKQKLQTLIEKNEVTPQTLLQLLADKQQAPIQQLPNTGVPLEVEKQLSSIFIDMKGYGTRCSTVILIDKNRNVTFHERTFPSQKDKQFQFQLIM